MESTEDQGAEGKRARAVTPKRLAQALTVVATVVGLLVGLGSLIDWAAHRVDAGHHVPAKLQAGIRQVTLRSDRQTLGGFLVAIGQDRTGYTPAELGEPGYVFDARVYITGSPGQKFPLSWSMEDRSRDRIVTGRLFAQTPVDLIPAATAQARTIPVWVPYPPRQGRYVVTFTLKDTDGTVEDEKASPLVSYPMRP